LKNADVAERARPEFTSELMRFDFKRVRETRALLIAALVATIGAMAGADAAAAEITGNAALTTDYVWRGTTQTQGDPAAQAGFKVTGPAGFYGSIWGSNVEFAPETQASSELDFTVGWSRSLGADWAIDLNVLRYQYPSTAVDLNWTELNGTVIWKQNYWASLGYSGDALGYDASGVYALIGARFPVNDKVRFEANLAHYLLDDEAVAANGYAHGLVSAVWTFKVPFEARITAHATDSNARAIFGAAAAGPRIEAALQATF